MRKFYSIASAAAAAVLALASCQKEAMQSETVIANGPAFELYVNADSKTANDGMNTLWVAKDEINLFHAVTGTTNYVNDAKFVISNVEVGRAEGTLAAELETGKSYDWYAMYPYSSHLETPANTTNYTTIGSGAKYSQTQTGNSSMAHISGKNVPMYGKVTNVAAGTTPSIQMHHLASLVKVDVKNMLDDAISVTGIDFDADQVQIVGGYFINIAGDKPVYVDEEGYTSSVAKLTVSNGAALAKGESASFYLAVKPFVAAEGDEINVTVYASAASGTGSHVRTISLAADKEFAAGKMTTVPVEYTTAINPLTPVTGQYSFDFEKQEIVSTGIVMLGDVAWDVDATFPKGAYFGFDTSNNKGQQFGSGSKPASAVSLTAKNYADPVTKVNVIAAGASQIVATIGVKVNGVAYTCNAETSVALSMYSTLYSFEPDGDAKTGEIEISIANSSEKAIYISSLSINPAPAELESIEVENPRANFKVGDTFEFGGKVWANYSDHSKKDVTSEAQFSGYDLSAAGTQTVTVSYSGKTATYSIVVSNPSTGDKTYTIAFSSATNEKGIGNYTSKWWVKDPDNDDFKWTLDKFNNNNNNWAFVKCGNKTSASVCTITTNSPIAEKIATVKLTIDAITAASVNSITLKVADNSAFTGATSYEIDKSTGTKVVSITSPAQNCYYKLEFDCAKGSANGLVTVSKVIYTTETAE